MTTLPGVGTLSNVKAVLLVRLRIAFTGKGDHRHFDGDESAYRFTTPEQLIADFQGDIARWNDENGDS